MQHHKKLRVVFIGCGSINSRVGALLMERQSNVEIAAIATADTPQARATIPDGIPFLSDPTALATLKPDLLVEAAGRAAIEQWIPKALRHTPAAILASTSAFSDGDFLSRLLEIAGKNDSRIIIPSGAIGGIDALASPAVLGLDTVIHQIAKPSLAWRGTAAEKLVDLTTLTAGQIFFSGSARDAARQYPQNANATVVTSLAGIGLDRTKVELIANPSLETNCHRVIAQGPFGKMEITLHNSSLTTNLKSSELTALSLAHFIERQNSALVI